MKFNTTVTIRPTQIVIDLTTPSPRVSIKGSVNRGTAVISEVNATVANPDLAKRLVDLVTAPLAARVSWLESADGS